MSGSGSQTSSSGGGFWKLHHAAIGIAILLLMIFVVRSCGGESEDERIDAEVDDAIPRQTIVVEVPATQWQRQPAPVTQQAYPPPAPVYPAQQPQYRYPVQPPAPPQPVYQVDPENPWAVRRRQPAYGGGSQPMQQQAPRWGQPSRQGPAYPQPGISQFRPLDDNRSTAYEQRPATPAAPRPAAPYDRLSGSSYGANRNEQGSWPYTGAYQGYSPYGVAPGGYPAVVPGTVYPGGVYPGGW